jgi:hypothetical protein
MPSRRYTLRLPRPLEAIVQTHLQTTGIPFADLMRDALIAYLADTPPTGEPTAEPTAEPTDADTPPTRADTLQRLAAQLADLTRRMERLEQERTPSEQRSRQRADRRADSPADTEPTGADRGADTGPTGADTPGPPRRSGRPPGPLRQQILALLQAHPAGLRAEELRVYLQTPRPIGDTLQGMLRGGVLTTQGRGGQRRYVATAPSPHDHT